MEASYTFQTRPTAGELWKFSIYYANKGMRGPVNIILTAGALFLLVIRWSDLELVQRMLLAFIAFLFLVWQPGVLYLKSLRQAKELEKQPPLTITFGEEGVGVSQGEQSGRIPWEQIGRIEAFMDLIIVYGEGARASLIPRSLLQENEQGFIELIHKKLPADRRKRI